MAFDGQDFQDLVELLRTHPEWRDDLRALLLTQELLELPAVVRELVDAVRALTERVDRLEAMQQQMLEVLRHQSERLDRLEEIQQQGLQTQLLMIETQRHLAERGDRLEVMQQQMLETQRQMLEIQQQMLEVQRHLERRVNRVESDVGDLKGMALEQHYRTHAYAYFGRLLRRMRVLDLRELADLLEDRLPPHELEQVLLADVVLTGQLRAVSQPTELWIVVEVSSHVDRTDVQRASLRADLLRRPGYRTLAAVAGRQVTRGGRTASAGLNVAVLEDGRVAGWEEALDRALQEGRQP